ncbi:MAG TPA: ABC transporter ATP-binding protein [Gammaproteobacteria bacterium]|nr:ABC transporter ATP-binding protein [Gammaproteobacteria bacterium]
MNPLLDVRDIECRYRSQTVVSGLSMHVKRGSLVCLLGPSGCGKTTALRAIAGFEPVFHGEICIDGNTVSRPGYVLAPEKRRLGMVFQDYALFPHMNVSDNVGFALRKTASAARRKMVMRMLQVVGLAEFQTRFPHELSGGQQQRVALARALAAQPEAILLDEPFSNLDVDTRERLSLEVREILKQEGITGILVTHHQDEAFALGDHIGVMDQGRILQWDTPFNLYHEPQNRFVADFIGQGTFLKGTMVDTDTVDTELGRLTGDRAYKWPKGTEVEVLIRPDDIVPDTDGSLTGLIIQKAFKGAEVMYTLELPSGNRVLSLFPSHHDYTIGTRVGIRADMHHVVAFSR